MPPVKKGGGGGGGGDDEVSRQMVATNYIKMCRSIGITSNSGVADVLRGSEDNEGPLKQLVLNDQVGKLGAGAIRAIATAFLGKGPSFSCGPYKSLQSIRIWKCFVGDDGLSAIANLLMIGAEHIPITYLEIMDCNVGPEGCKALGEALDGKHATKLLTLKINYNPQIGDDGVSHLCRGLFTNQVLKQLHLEYCQIGPEGARALGQVLSMPKSALTVLSLQGNSISSGLQFIAKGAKRSCVLSRLNLSDNAINQELEGLCELRDALIKCPTLTAVDFTFNPLDNEGAQTLLPALVANTKLKTFLVDATLPPELFAKLNRMDDGGGGGGNGASKKGGKKKKKKS